jgi:hypothetical protein
MNIMYVVVTERTAEIGLKKAVGAKSSDILSEFLIEAILVTITGGEAWMADAQTSVKKFEIARDLGIRGVAMWVLGQEDPKTWVEWDKFNSK